MEDKKRKQSVVCNYCGALMSRHHIFCKECGHTFAGWFDRTKYNRLATGGYMARNFGPGNQDDPYYQGFYE